MVSMPGQSFKVELEEVLARAITPSRTVIVRSKQAILEELTDGDVHATTRLVKLLADADGVTLPSGKAPLELSDGNTVDENHVFSHPTVQHYGYQLAGAEALAELAAQGIIYPYASPPVTHPPAPWSLPPRIDYNLPGSSSGVAVQVARPQLEESYRLSPGVASNEDARWWLDADLFTADLDSLDLDARTRRCLQEALAAYRRGLYLAALNMLGSGVEGAWFSAATRVRHLDQSVANVLTGDRPTVGPLQKALTDLLRSHNRVQAEELAVHAAFLRELRNYGLHIRPEEDKDLERHFDEASCGTIMLATHRHLTGLANAVSRLL